MWFFLRAKQQNSMIVLNIIFCVINRGKESNKDINKYKNKNRAREGGAEALRKGTGVNNLPPPPLLIRNSLQELYLSKMTEKERSRGIFLFLSVV